TRISEAGTSTLAMLQRFVRNQGDGWSWAQDYLGRASYNVVDSHADAAEALDGYAEFAAGIGRRLGELHLALATPGESPMFGIEPAGENDVAAWVEDIRSGIDAALSMIESATQWADSRMESDARQLLAQRTDLLAAVPRLAAHGIGTPRTVIHGDFHLAQVLVSSGDVFIVDLEGEPSSATDRRRAKASPLKDLAGLLRSFDYASMCALSAQPEGGDGIGARAEWLEDFRRQAAGAAIGAYAAATGRNSDDFAAGAPAGSLLRLFVLEKAAYEIRYEMANRPTWAGVPIRGLLGLVDGVIGEPP
ncbi:MAG: phosphotransferase, partial [Rhodanobacteraceae bacterium]